MVNNVVNPLVSIIMPSFNVENTISTSIESILSQDYDNWELIITDDCSTDTTVSIVQTFQKIDSRIRLYQNSKNSGSGISRNNSISHANGKYIAFLDADDLWRFDKLSKQIGFMEENFYDFTYTSYQKFDSKGPRKSYHPQSSVNYNQLLRSNVIGCLTAIYNAETLGKVYMPTIRRKQDFGLWLLILKRIPRAYCLDLVLADYRCDSGVTSNKFHVLSHQWRFYREVVGLSRIKSCLLFLSYAAFGFVKFIK
ncbi:putative teichuronic acid biosynthesis glycosyltransferase TuaG [Vibrio crassostreae]|uniref:glycosyltransferase family 2 protein n=1 Tax=Vibrio crassostreae TaxID=246167 RepID=UPI00104CB661|nr:glycosyltransferase family 2 protein [Vibrio crassostreae]TCN85190.1 glycosyltransferase involved in cell wall biosynthesis [Vibrio crassostreae]CAK3028984.1 putative teichuronic acid biosynthesis glycosyltransferase TuaG [Vibrio crassostreae]